LGIEVELGLVDGRTMALCNAFPDVAEKLPAEVGPFIKSELMQCVAEVITDVCDTVDDAEQDLRRKLTALESVTDQLGLRLWWGSSHPFSSWQEQKITQDERYLQLV